MTSNTKHRLVKIPTEDTSYMATVRKNQRSRIIDATLHVVDGVESLRDKATGELYSGSEILFKVLIDTAVQEYHDP